MQGHQRCCLCSMVSISMPSSLRWLLCCMLLLHVWYTSTCLVYIYLIMRQLFLHSKFYSISSRSMRAIFFIHSSYVFTELRRALVDAVHGATAVSHACDASPWLNLVVSLMTSSSTSCSICGRFPLQKQIQKYNRNTYHPEPSVFRSMAQIKTYPFAVLYAKETPYFWKINPQFKTCLHILFSSFESVLCFG